LGENACTSCTVGTFNTLMNSSQQRERLTRHHPVLGKLIDFLI